MKKIDKKIIDSIDYKYYSKKIIRYSIPLFILTLTYTFLLIDLFEMILLLIAIINIGVFLICILLNVIKLKEVIEFSNDCEFFETDNYSIVETEFSRYFKIKLNYDNKEFLSEKVICLNDLSLFKENNLIKFAVKKGEEKIIVLY